MPHLTLETLARLVDEEPTADQAMHLAACAACRDELAELRGQTEALAELPALEPPAMAWPALEARLRREGLVRGAGRWSVGVRTVVLLRMAAALALFFLGGVAGAAWRGGAGPAGAVTAAGDGASDSAAVTAASLDEVQRLLHEREEAYLTALAHYAALTGSGDAEDPVAQLAALEGIVSATRAALRHAPADPVINGYHLTAVAQREAAVRQIAANSTDPWF